MNPSGVFAVSRSIWTDDDFPPEPFTQREAWLWLISASVWKEHRIRGVHGPTTLQRGEFSFSVRFLADKWDWSKSRVDRFILTLKNRDMIRDVSRDNEKVYLIKNYNEFQILSLPNRDTIRDDIRDTSGTRAGHERDKEEDIKKDIKRSIPFSKENGQAIELPLAVADPKPNPKPPDPWKEVYDIGKEAFGREAGGLITLLRKLYDQKPHKVLAKIKDAQEQREPLRWICAFLHTVDDGGRLSGEYIGGVPP